MAFSAQVASKQPDEIKVYLVDFLNGLSDGETITGLTVLGYEWDDRDQVGRSFDLEASYPTADMACLSLHSAGALLHSEEISLAAAHTRLLVRALNDDAWQAKNDLVVEGSKGWDNTTAWCRIAGGIDQHTYKLTFRVTTSDNNQLEADIIIPVEEK